MNKNPIVSVLVHTKNSERTIAKHLESIKNQSYKNIEIIVVDNKSVDNTLKIANNYTKKIFTHGPERSAQRNFAASRATGEFFLVPDSDMILGKNVISDCIVLIRKRPTIRAIVIPEKSIGTGFWAKCKKLERSFYIDIGWMEAARFFSRDTFEGLGGYDERNTGTEDYDLPHRIEEKYGNESIGRIQSFMYHDEGRLSLWKTIIKKFYYARNLDVYKLRRANIFFYRKQSNIFLRLMLFFSHPIRLFKNPAVGVGMLIMKVCEFSAGGLGVLFKHKTIKPYEAR